MLFDDKRCSMVRLVSMSMANVLLLFIPFGSFWSGNGAPRDLDSLFEAMDLNRDGSLDGHDSLEKLEESTINFQGIHHGDWG